MRSRTTKNTLFAAACGLFALALSGCPRPIPDYPIPEVCGDSLDNDQDGFVDCDDQDCESVCGMNWNVLPSTCGASSIPSTGTYYGYSYEQTAYSRYGGSCGGSAAPESIYSFQVDVADTVCVSTVGSSYDTLLYVREGCDGLEVACNDDAYGLQSEVELYAVPGVNYHVFVDGYSTASGDYQLNVEYGPCGPPAVEDCYNGWDDDGDGYVDFDDWDCADDGADYCSTALPILETGMHYGNTMWGSGYSEWYSACGGMDAPEAVHSFSLGYSDTVCINTIGSAFDTLLYVVEGCMGSEVACNDDWVGLQSQVELYAYANTTYYVFVDGYSMYDYGDYYLDIQIGPCNTSQEICGNGLDDDYDGWVDCDDWDCVYECQAPGVCEQVPEAAMLTDINVISPDNTYLYCNDALEVEFWSDRDSAVYVEIGEGSMSADVFAGYNRITVAQAGYGGTIAGFDGEVTLTPYNPCSYTFGTTIETDQDVHIGLCACPNADPDICGGEVECNDPFNPDCN